MQIPHSSNRIHKNLSEDNKTIETDCVVFFLLRPFKLVISICNLYDEYYENGIPIVMLQYELVGYLVLFLFFNILRYFLI